MQLTREEEKALSGEHGEATAIAYRVLVAIGEATNAQNLIPIEWAHISGVNYNTIGDSGLDFLKKIVKDGKVKVKTSLNPMGFDRKNLPDLSQDFIDKQFEITKLYEKIGVTPTFSCIPYEILPIPESGTQVSFAESSAAVLANSYLNIKTNKESALSALASAIVGKAPFSDLRMEELRNPDFEIVNELKVENELDYGLLGYFIGKTVKKSCAGLCNVSRNTDFWNIKSLSAGIGTSGSWLSNVNGKEEINSAGLAYFLIKNFDRNHNRLSQLPIISAISKDQDIGENRSLISLNNEILQTAIKENTIEQKKGLTISEIETTPITNVLENNIIHYIKEITWVRLTMIKILSIFSECILKCSLRWNQSDGR